MREAAVVVMRGVVLPLGEHLPAEAVPVALQQRAPLGLRQQGKVRNVVRVIVQKDLVIVHFRRDENPVARHFQERAVRLLDLHFRDNPRP